MVTDIATKLWQGTHLWKELEAREPPDSPALRYVHACMEVLEPVLRAGGSPGDMTLHDDRHGFNVAQEMVEVVGADRLGTLSTLDVVALLLAAHAHDVGMAPALGLITAIHDYLVTLEPPLDPDEEAALLQWLDDEQNGLCPPLTGMAPGRVRRLVTMYARHRHNDWSGAWIDEHLRKHEALLYVGFTDDLIVLCRSHHQGYEELKSERFNPRPKGSPAQILHLRFCACVLRMADVLDIDRERTPAILLDHRDVHEDSKVFWLKDHLMSVLHDGPARIVITSQPPDAIIHRAVKETIDGIDRELQLCRRLADETKFDQVPGLSGSHGYEWRLDTAVHADITPLGDAYEYMDGTFRPDSAKVLQLLGGLALYRTPLAAVRELLQNALDAVREQIARERLKLDDPNDADRVAAIRQLHGVVLRLEARDDGLFLTCSDDGCGMTRALLRDRFLVGGSSKRHAELQLERDAREAGFEVGRTAEFGIGVLSYFIIGSRMRLHTRRDPEAADADGEGWQFSTRGYDDFGELRRMRRESRGTDVELELRADVIGEDAGEVEAALERYLEETIRHLPCRVTFVRATDGGKRVWPAGFADRSDEERQSVLDRFESRSGEPIDALLTRSSREYFERSAAYKRERRAAAAEQLAWYRWEGLLPGDLGAYRISLPYFRVEGGACLALVGPPEDLYGRRLAPPEVTLPRGRVEAAWNGMHVEQQMPSHRLEGALYPAKATLDPGSAWVEVDWRHRAAGVLAVDRSGLTLSDAAAEALDWLSAEVRRLVAETIATAGGDRHAAVNHRLTGLAMNPDVPLVWPVVHGGADAVSWEPVTFPAADMEDVPQLLYGDAKTVRWRGQPLMLLGRLSFEDGSSLPWAPTHIVLNPRPATAQQEARNDLVGIWAHDPRTARPETLLDGAKVAFAPQLDFLLGASVGEDYGASLRTPLWNQSHPVVRAATDEAVAWCAANLPPNGDPTQIAEELLADPSRAAAWICTIATGLHENYSLWEALVESASELLQRIARTLIGEPDADLGAWVNKGRIDTRWRRLSPVVASTYYSEALEFAPDAEWDVQVEPAPGQ